MDCECTGTYEFFKSSVEYFGHGFDATGLKKSTEKEKAILQAPSPGKVSQFCCFSRLLNYHGKFLPNLPTVLAPLHEVLEAKKKWKGTRECNMNVRKQRNS